MSRVKSLARRKNNRERGYRGFLPKLTFSRAKKDHKAGVFDGWSLFPCK
jgi:hypothetical protein